MHPSSQSRPEDGREREDPLDARICERACRQHLVIALRQIVGLGLSGSAVRSRVGAGRLHAVHRGVFSLVPPRMLTERGRIMAAVLACRPGATASHRAAAALYELRLGRRRWVDVTTPGATGRDRGPIRVHCGMTLTPADVTIVDGVPCTTLEAFLLLARSIGRPPDGVNQWIAFPAGGGAEADFVWHVGGSSPRSMVATSTRRGGPFERDRRRDQRLTLLGYRVVRFSWREVMHEPRYGAATPAALVAP